MGKGKEGQGRRMGKGKRECEGKRKWKGGEERGTGRNEEGKREGKQR